MYFPSEATFERSFGSTYQPKVTKGAAAMQCNVPFIFFMFEVVAESAKRSNVTLENNNARKVHKALRRTEFKIL